MHKVFSALVSDISSVSPFTTYVQVQCSEDPEYTTSVILTMYVTKVS